MNHTTLRCAAACLLVAAPATAQIPVGWAQVANSGPSPRFGHAMTFDPAAARILLFGGYQFALPLYLNDTWTWDGASWTQVASTGPSPRWAPAMCYDSARQRVVLFGGEVFPGTQFPAGPLGDTWEWDGAQWILASTTGPSARSSSGMAFDAARSETVLVGGQFSSSHIYDTWVWRNGSWSSAGSSPTIDYPTVAFDASSQVVVLPGKPLVSPLLPRSWQWNGSTWSQYPSFFANCPVPDEHAFVFDSARNRGVVFGGYESLSRAYQGDTWDFDGTSWTQTSAGRPSPRSRHAMAFDSVRGRTVMFGGTSGFLRGDTWELGRFQATATVFGTGCGTPPLQLVPGAGSRPVLGSTQVTDLLNVPPTASAMGIGLGNTSYGPFLLPFPLGGFGLTGCRQYHDLAVTILSPMTPPVAGVSQHNLPLPIDPLLLNLHVYLQAWAIDPAANPFGAVVSNAVDLTLGNQ